MPDGWLDTELPNDRAKRCGVTSSGYGFKEAHLAPSEMEEWYARNDMRRYGADISKDYNTFPLRSDLHFLFDKRLAFVIAPKQRRVPPATSSTETPGNSAETAGTSAETRKADWVLHVIHTDGSEIWPEHHNTVVRSLHPQAQPYLLARLAWAVIPDVKGFLTASFDRKVVRLKASPSSGYEEVIIAGAALMDAYGGGGDKAAKPKTPGSSSRKRRKTGSIPGEKGDSIDGSSDNSGDDSDFWDDVGSEAVHTMRKVSCERAPDDTSNGQKLRREVEMELRNSAMGIVE